jgi:hypothetical protein
MRHKKKTAWQERSQKQTKNWKQKLGGFNPCYDGLFRGKEKFPIVETKLIQILKITKNPLNKLSDLKETQKIGHLFCNPNPLLFSLYL